jgi:hypothetical protein
VKEKATVGFPFWGAFPLTASLRLQMMSMYIYLFTIAISVNYSSEFWELFEDTAYNVDKLKSRNG